MRVFVFLIALAILTGCIKEVKLDLRNPEPILVVEGLLITDSTPCKVALSYSGIFNDRGAQLQYFINDAIVFIKGDANDSIQLISQGNGNYIQVDKSFVAQTGRSYSISITLAKGERYASYPEKILPVQKDFEIDSIGIGVPFKLNDLYGADVQIRLHDPGDETNYYRWVTRDYIPRKATGIPCGFYSPPCFQYCFQVYEDRFINILSDANFNGNEMRYQSTPISPYYWYGKHYIEIKQLSLSRQAYQFWKLYLEQTSRTGSILDPLPSPIQGNVYNIDHPEDLALGYFEVSDVSSKKIVLAPIFINSYYTLAYVNRYISEGACYEIYPNATTYEPIGWENAPIYIYNVY